MPLRGASFGPNSELAAAADEYLEEKAASTRAATRAIYRTALGAFLTWAGRERISSPAELTQRVVARWVTYLREEHRTPHGKPLSETTVRTYSTTINFWLRWLGQRGEVDERLRAQAPKRRPRVIDVLTREEMAQLEAGAVTERDKLLIRVLADTGARLGEALELREQDIVEPARRQYAVKLGGKTGERLVSITPGLYKRLRRYIEHGRPREYYGSRIFVGLHRVGDDGRYQVPGRTTIARMIREAGERAGLKKRVHAHLLRHSAITHLLRSGTNPLLVARVAGHTSLEMIRSTYAHLTLADEHEAMMRALLSDD